MLTTKRVLIATICGLIFGTFCMYGAINGPNAVGTPIALMILFSRGLLGFTIGISALKFSWWLHGIIVGFAASIPMALSVMDQPTIMFGTLVAGMVIGFLIETITTKLFKESSVANKL